MGWFTKDEELNFEEIPDKPQQTAARSWLESLYRRDLKFPLQGTADLSDTQMDIQAQLSDVIDQYGGDYEAAADYYRGVLEGDYDPRTSPYYEGLRQEATLQKQMAQRDVARAAQKAGMSRSTPAVGIQGLVGNAYDSKILQALGSLYENERNRQTTAAGSLPALRSSQISTMDQANQLADLPRQIEQAKMDALYQKALQTLLAPYTYQANIAASILNEQRYTGYTTGGGLTDWGFLINAGANAAGSYAGAKAGASG